MHLTNFSINKKNVKFVKNNDKNQSDSDGDEDSSKWDFKQLEAAFTKQGANFKAVQ